MEHVRQRDHMDCGVACMAMLAGHPYEWAMELAGDPERYAYGLRVDDIRILLRANGVIVASDSARAFQNSGTWLTLIDYGASNGHLVVIHDGQIYDPGNDAATRVEEFALETILQGGRIEHSWAVLSELDEVERLRGELTEARNEAFSLRCEVATLLRDAPPPSDLTRAQELLKAWREAAGGGFISSKCTRIEHGGEAWWSVVLRWSSHVCDTADPNPLAAVRAAIAMTPWADVENK